MKTLKYLFFIVCISLFYACDIMEKEPLNIISEKAVYNDPVLIEAHLGRIYANLSFLNREGNGTQENVDPVSTLADEGRHARDWHNLYIKWKAGLLDFSGGLLEMWNYSQIRTVNEFLEKIQESSLPADTKKEMVARARFARAITYFYMVKRYGGIPILTKPQAIDASQEELFVSRNKEVEVYDFIISEIDEIAGDLPATRDKMTIGYPSRYTALALKSRAAMYAASIATWGEVQIDGLVGIPASEARRFWQASYDASKQIIESGIYKLYNKVPDDKAENFRKLFVDENNEEVIFSWQLTGLNVKSDYDLFMSPLQYVSWGSSMTSVYLEMVESFENKDGSPGTFDVERATNQTWNLTEFFADKDPRFHASINYEGVVWRGEPIENWRGIIKRDGSRITSGRYENRQAQGRSYSLAGAIGASITGFNVHKYLDETLSPIAEGKTKIDFIVFRLGEIMLNYAEAAFELGATDEALQKVNALRERAGIALLSTITRDKIRQERKVELAFEGHRWWDLKRWRIAEATITRNYRGIYTYYDAASEKFKIEIKPNAHNEETPAKFEKKHYYLPITNGRISNNPNLAPENPGYY
ncbi:MAG: RagB/SusD family nutrient uptake outer membrane protein [Dysgonamonadaceae bacterium]|jgi:hypothetical protein|nr:RagB/SusD family nutrient uptake outer membrane protein [Dysgonamonadaceae bacterium]